ncbi:MAG: universal stress protein [Chloroflexi bacterium]|nr:universal stress protein [Chloroflexota bacterium]MDA1271861.1 universal stress protein [Chloroflexota bacterium]
MFSRILVPLDGSRLSAKCLLYATEIAGRFDSEIILLRAVPPIALASSIGFAGASADVLGTQALMEGATNEVEDQLNRVRRYLNGKRRELERRGINASTHAEAADAGHSILNAVKQHRIDLIIMASHGRSGLKRALLGSVSDEIVRDAGVPVLVIRQ